MKQFELYQIMLSMMYLLGILTEVESGVWSVDVTQENNSILTMITEMNARASDFNDHIQDGKTYPEVFDALSSRSKPPDKRLDS
jgi:hypothetical protein